jgi:anti-sigma regulatory factor (Ser/Thr protein kinase)
VPEPSRNYLPPEEVLRRCNRPLPPPPGEVATLRVDAAGLGALRATVAAVAAAAGLTDDRIDDLRIAVTELASNAITHSGDPAALRWWLTPDELVCEVACRSALTDPLAGRIPAPPGSDRGRGLLLVNQLCDLVEIHTGDGWTTVRLHLDRPPSALPVLALSVLLPYAPEPPRCRPCRTAAPGGLGRRRTGSSASL